SRGGGRCAQGFQAGQSNLVVGVVFVHRGSSAGTNGKQGLIIPDSGVESRALITLSGEPLQLFCADKRGQQIPGQPVQLVQVCGSQLFWGVNVVGVQQQGLFMQFLQQTPALWCNFAATQLAEKFGRHTDAGNGLLQDLARVQKPLTELLQQQLAVLVTQLVTECDGGIALVQQVCFADAGKPLPAVAG